MSEAGELRAKIRAVLDGWHLEGPPIPRYVLEDIRTIVEREPSAPLPDSESEKGDLLSPIVECYVPGCVFCDRILNKQFDRESAYAVAFPPLNPATDGHMLVIPRWHIPDAAAAPDQAADAFHLAAVIAKDVGDANLITSIGSAATQTVFHMHMHVVPRRDGDGLKLPWTRNEAMATSGRRIGMPDEAQFTFYRPGDPPDVTDDARPIVGERARS